jgi:hypothetical protein
MTTYNEQMQGIWNKYEAAGMPMPATAKEIAAWAIEHGHWAPRRADVIAQCAEDLAKAFREEYRTDSQGRRYRAKLAARKKTGGRQLTFWEDIDKAEREFMQLNVAQRRQQIVGDCYRVKIEVDHYNDMHPSEPPIQVVLDFSRDVEELQSLDDFEEDPDD